MTAAAEGRRYVFYGIAKLIPGLAMFAAVPLWTRQFGMVQYGVYATCWVAAALSSSAACGWLRQANLRYTGESNFDLSHLPRWVVPVCGATSGLVVGLVALSWTSLGQATNVWLLAAIGSLFAAVNAYYTLILTWSQRHGRAGRYASAEIVRVGGALGGSFAFAALGLDGGAAILLGFAVGALAGLTVLRTQAVREPGVDAEMRRAVLATYWEYGWPMALWLTVSSALVYADRLLIGALMDAEAVGIYGSMADMIVRGVGMAAFPVTMSAHPVLMQEWNSGRRRAAVHRTRRYLRLMLVVAAVLVAGGAWAGPAVLEVLLGVPRPSAAVVGALFAGAVFWQVGLMSHKLLEMADRTKLLLGVIAAITAGSLVANLLLIPSAGIAAPAYVFAAGAGAYVIVTIMLGEKLVASVETGLVQT